MNRDFAVFFFLAILEKANVSLRFSKLTNLKNLITAFLKATYELEIYEYKYIIHWSYLPKSIFY